MNPHKKFILTPVSSILEEAISAMKLMGNGIETYPFSEYALQSIFIQMTGSQEQKMKCISWELATNDFEFRRDFLKNFNGEFSQYSDKNKVYTELYSQIDDALSNDIKKHILLSSKLQDLLLGSNLQSWSDRQYKEYIKLWSKVTKANFATEKTNLLGKNNNANSICLQTIYIENLYKNRNRIAHNTVSYQHNLPTLETLKNENYQYENYFLWFSILILIDNIFIELYKKYLERLEQRNFGG